MSAAAAQAAEAEAVAQEVTELSRRHQRFVESYCEHFNQTQAAKDAGFSAKSAKFQGHRLMKLPEIREAIDRRMDELGMSSAEITLRLSRQAQGELPTKVRKLRQGKKVKGTVEEYDAHAALDKMAKVRGLYEGEDTLVGKLLIVRDPDEVLAEMRAKKANQSTPTEK